MNNPFAQAQSYIQLTVRVPAAAALAVDESFGDITLSTAAWEENEDKAIWRVELLFGEQPDTKEIERRLKVLAEYHHFAVPTIETQEIAAKDWTASMAYDFPPLEIGRFFVHGSHVKDIPHNVFPIQVDAGMAFGSGEHATTTGCLRAIEKYLPKSAKRVLDMGTGSGILAIGIAKRSKTTHVTAVEIDLVSARVAEENMQKNTVQSQVCVLHAGSYHAPGVAAHAPYDAIVANILARPLKKMAKDLDASLAHGGLVILSGLLASQANDVAQAHRSQGLTLKKKLIIGDWATLVLEKPYDC